jgi:hypothetical protein
MANDMYMWLVIGFEVAYLRDTAGIVASWCPPQGCMFAPQSIKTNLTDSKQIEAILRTRLLQCSLPEDFEGRVHGDGDDDAISS